MRILIGRVVVAAPEELAGVYIPSRENARNAHGKDATVGHHRRRLRAFPMPLGTAANRERCCIGDEGSRFEKSHPYWGAAASPIVEGDRVIVHFGTDSEGELLALDVKSGKPVWRQGTCQAPPSFGARLL